MSEIKRPNLFSWAPSELSQDAFFCWLSGWLNCDDPKLTTQFVKTDIVATLEFADTPLVIAIEALRSPDQLGSEEIRYIQSVCGLRSSTATL